MKLKTRNTKVCRIIRDSETTSAVHSAHLEAWGNGEQTVSVGYWQMGDDET